MKREFIIDGEQFNDIEGFYCEIDKLFTKDLDWKTGHNLDAFNDILYGGFGVHKFKEPIKMIWKNFSKSRKDLSYEATVKHYEQDLALYYDREKITNIVHFKAINMDDYLKDNINRLEKKLCDAQNGKGETLLDIIVKIISDNKEHDRTLEIIE